MKNISEYVIQEYILEGVTKDYMTEGCSIELRDILNVLPQGNGKLKHVTMIYKNYLNSHQDRIQKRLSAGSYVYIFLRISNKGSIEEVCEYATSFSQRIIDEELLIKAARSE